MKNYSIYKITNIHNNKCYIGQTTNPTRRWKEHIDSAKYIDLPLYKDINTYGITSFTFQILEQNIGEDKIDNQEAYWIKTYDSQNKQKGYNIEPGGNKASCSSKLTEKQITEIKARIRDKQPFKNIAALFNINVSTVSDINNGDIWYDENENYPLYATPYRRKHFTKEQLSKIKSMLMNGYTTVEIAKKFETSVTTICKINNGKIYVDKNQDYPISKSRTSPKHLTSEKTIEIAKMLTNTDYTYTKISRICNVGRKTVSRINQGTEYRKHLEQNGIMEFPIRR